jgi:hypothetical protein
VIHDRLAAGDILLVPDDFAHCTILLAAHLGLAIIAARSTGSGGAAIKAARATVPRIRG